MRSRAEVIDYITKLKKELVSYNTDVLDVYIMPDFLSFEVVKNDLQDIPIYAGLQDTFWEDYGSFAGEVAPLMLKDLGCSCVYMGHSERKIYFGETNENINKKVLACLRNGIIPFLFVGETKEEFDKKITEKILKEQLETCLKDVSADLMKSLVIIYEPRWAIGKEDAASPDIIDACHKKVRKLIVELYNSDTTKLTRILYGGSVNLDNISTIIKIPNVDGVGSTRSSLDPINFIKMIRLVEKESEYRKAIL